MKKKKIVLDDILKLNEDVIAVMINDYYDYHGYDNYIYHLDDFDEVFASQTPFDVALNVFYGTFSPACEYFTFDGYGNIESVYPSIHLCKIDTKEFLEFINNNIKEYKQYFKTIKSK